MDCRKCNDDLTAYLDEELPDAETAEMSGHLEKCPPCREEWEGLRSSMNFIDIHVREIDPTPQIWNRLHSRLVELPPAGGPFGLFRFLAVYRRVTALGTFAATLVLAVGIWGFMQYRHSQSELESYMNDYIQIRTMAEKLHTLQMARPVSFMDALAPYATENPFSETRPVSFTNPFRVEER